MKIDYKETTDDLLTRINIHDVYGARDIDKWMLEVLPLKQGMTILDVGCGAGKQCFSYLTHLSGKAAITGGDVSQELLSKAEEENNKLGHRVKFQELDFNQAFPMSPSFSCSITAAGSTMLPIENARQDKIMPGAYCWSRTICTV